jgi:hypothetical protein
MAAVRIDASRDDRRVANDAGSEDPKTWAAMRGPGGAHALHAGFASFAHEARTVFAYEAWELT